MQNKLSNHHIYLLIIFITAFLIRLTNINSPLLEFFPPRQTQTAEITRNIYVNGWPDFWTPKVRNFTNGSPIPYVLEFPLYNGIVALAYQLFGPNVIWGRIVSLAFFLGSTLIFYRLAIVTIPAIPTILAILFFTFSPLHILISRSFQPEELALFLLLFAVYKKSWLIFSLAVLTKLPITLFTPVLIYQQLQQQTSSTVPTLRQNPYLVIVKLLVSLLPASIWYFRAGQLTIHPAISRNFELSNWFQPQLWLQPRWYFSLFQIEQVLLLTTLGLLFFWLGFLLKLSEKKIDLWFIWLASGFLYLSIFNYHAMTHEYYHLFLLPPLSVFIGLGLSKILKITKGFSKNIRTLSIAGILLLFLLGLIQPAIKKIITAPESPEESEEINVERYRLILTSPTPNF